MKSISTVSKEVLAENLVEHDFDVVAGVPVAVVIEAAGFLEHAVQFDAARAHVLDVGLGRFVAVFEAALLLRLAPENFVVAIRVERRVDVDQIDAAIRQLAQLIEIIAAVDNPRVEQRGRFCGHLRSINQKSCTRTNI
jgi:hypothetical protein